MSSYGLDVDVGNFDENGNPEPYYMGRMYWAAMGSFIGLAFVFRASDYLLGRIRMRRRSSSRSHSALSRLYTTCTSLVRSLTYPTPLILQRHPAFFSLPSVGRALLALLYLGFILALCFYKQPLKTDADWENAGFRTGWLALAQLPMVILLASRRLNIISFLTGSSSSVSLNFFHRWVARGVVLTASLHWLYMSRGPFNLNSVLDDVNKLDSNGIGGWLVLAWLALLSSLRPLRRAFYEIFFANHVASTIVLFIVLLLHTTDYTQLKAHDYIFIALGLYIGDVVVRWIIVLFFNISFSREQPGLCRFTASVRVMPDLETILIEIPTAAAGRGIRRYKWKPGQHVTISFPTVAPFTSHPFTVSSLAKDEKMLFVVRVKTGFTRTLLNKTLAASQEIQEDKNEQQIGIAAAPVVTATASFPVLVDLPHGGPTRDWNQFETVLAVVSGVGATFGFSVIRDVLCQSRASQVKMIWCVKRYADIGHFDEQLRAVLAEQTERVIAVQQGLALDDAKLQNSAADHHPVTSNLSLHIYIFISDCATEPSSTSLGSLSEFLNAHADIIHLVPSKPSDLRGHIGRVLEQAAGETGVAVCGSASLSAQVKNIVAALLSGGATNGCWVHSEQFQA
ncbi:hypothetical protein POJ06DRAFT_191907 [Lipomyces tetrasporus]|uniref:ferric-chelate reductase (NADPH) n=1 Tax=Lipomyces tetrasporus TaxID=54092 RepID=A0AAD7QZM5_9ASCO|nr:uncharacterized protein POJ06DRAFT_191907 [Lipomyces tetrasporus]KAJ8104413.1 hypothetical protein POJ06DRAFT_191907 [Lipomyces tetrasporus]